jgi:pimeloyl-ACP methyl ester carboxylesterase
MDIEKNHKESASAPDVTRARSPVFLGGLAGDDYGEDGDLAPLVLLHGLSFDRRMWGPFLEELERLDPGRRVLTLDLPGHGASDPMPYYDLEHVVDAIHAVIQQSDLDAPVIVGHSISGVIATLYAARYPTRGIVNVDQPLQTVPFAKMLHSISDGLRGPEFPSIWAMLSRNFHTELLSPAGRELVEAMSRPRQEIVLGYWQQVMDRSLAEHEAFIESVLSAAREAGVPYLVITGSEPERQYVEWLAHRLPQARIVVFADSGHFPHLAHPDLFALEVSRFLHGTGP